MPPATAASPPPPRTDARVAATPRWRRGVGANGAVPLRRGRGRQRWRHPGTKHQAGRRCRMPLLRPPGAAHRRPRRRRWPASPNTAETGPAAPRPATAIGSSRPRRAARAGAQQYCAAGAANQRLLDLCGGEGPRARFGWERQRGRGGGCRLFGGGSTARPTTRGAAVASASCAESERRALFRETAARGLMWFYAVRSRRRGLALMKRRIADLPQPMARFVMGCGWGGAVFLRRGKRLCASQKAYRRTLPLGGGLGSVDKSRQGLGPEELSRPVGRVQDGYAFGECWAGRRVGERLERRVGVGAQLGGGGRRLKAKAMLTGWGLKISGSGVQHLPVVSSLAPGWGARIGARK